MRLTVDSNNNQASQEILLQAEAILANVLAGEASDESPRLQVAYALIVAMRIYSASSNNTPGFRGLGLEEALALAAKIIANPKLTERTVKIRSYKNIVEALEL